jgi:excisionase family DNA binding protein
MAHLSAQLPSTFEPFVSETEASQFARPHPVTQGRLERRGGLPGQEAQVGLRLLYDRKEAARQLSISIRSLDYLIAGKKLGTCRIGKKILIPRTELIRFSRCDHLKSVAGGAS